MTEASQISMVKILESWFLNEILFSSRSRKYICEAYLRSYQRMFSDPFQQKERQNKPQGALTKVQAPPGAGAGRTSLAADQESWGNRKEPTTPGPHSPRERPQAPSGGSQVFKGPDLESTTVPPPQPGGKAAGPPCTGRGLLQHSPRSPCPASRSSPAGTARSRR